MARPTNYEEAEAVHNDILSRSPEGCRLPRAAFDRLLVAGYRKSVQSAKRISETGAHAGFWTLHRNTQGAAKGLQGWVEIHPATVEQAMPAPAMPT